MKISRLTLLLLVSMLMLFSRPGHASTDYIEVVLEVANNIVNKAGKIQEEIASQINAFITDKLSKLAGDYMNAKKKLKKAERIKKRLEKSKERIEKLKERAEKAKKRKEALMERIRKLEEKAAKLQEKYNKAMKTVNEFKEKVAEAKEEIDKIKEIAGDGIAMVKEAQDAIDGFSTTVSGLKSAANSKIDEAKSMAAEAKSKVDNKLEATGIKAATKSQAPQAEQTPIVQEKVVNPVTVLPAAEEVEDLAQQTVIKVENSDKINTQEILRTDVSADEIMRLSETSDVNALNAASEIGQLSIQEQLKRLNTDKTKVDMDQKVNAAEKAKAEILKVKAAVQEDNKVKESTRTTFGQKAVKLNSISATRVLMREASNE